MKIGDTDDEDSPWWTIVGVVGGVRDNRLDQPPDPTQFDAWLSRVYVTA